MQGGGSSRRTHRSFLVFLIIAAVIVGGYLIGNRLESEGRREERSQMTEGFGRFEEKIYQGKTYYKKTGLTTMLLMGIDREIVTQDPDYVSWRDGGQADFLLLLVIDRENKTIRQLQIERDTMAKVHVLTVLGQDGGSRPLQICLSHGYGATQEECCRNTVSAVSGYLDFLPIDAYMAVDYSAIAPVNDLLGGVTVTLEEDFTAEDPTMIRGATLTLRGKQAEIYVRSRINIGDGTNASRQGRQRNWLTGATERLKNQARDNSGFFGTILDTMGNRLVTNAGRGRLINEFNQAAQYEVFPVEQIPGAYRRGRDGFTEYHTKPEDVTKWIIDVFYRPVENPEDAG